MSTTQNVPFVRVFPLPESDMARVLPVVIDCCLELSSKMFHCCAFFLIPVVVKVFECVIFVRNMFVDLVYTYSSSE